MRRVTSQVNMSSARCSGSTKDQMDRSCLHIEQRRLLTSLGLTSRRDMQEGATRKTVIDFLSHEVMFVGEQDILACIAERKSIEMHLHLHPISI